MSVWYLRHRSNPAHLGLQVAMHNGFGVDVYEAFDALCDHAPEVTRRPFVILMFGQPASFNLALIVTLSELEPGTKLDEHAKVETNA